MDFLIKEVKTSKRVQNNIEKFESLTLSEKEGKISTTGSTKSSNLVVEHESSAEPVPLLTEVSSRPTRQNSRAMASEEVPTTMTATTKQLKPQHQRKQSAIFTKQEYLNQESAQPELADDAREILKCQPGIQDIEAVLTYIQYGIDAQHDFNIKVTGPMSSTLLRVLITITVPDVWPNLSTSRSDASTTALRGTLLNALFSAAGIELLLEQIRILSRTSNPEQVGILEIYVDFLANLLKGTDTVLRLLRDVTTLYQKDVQRRLFWQSIVALLGGSKILATTAALSSSSPANRRATFEWLTVGAHYSKWLAKNIVKAAIELKSQDLLDWTNLGQVFKRGLSLGYRDDFVATIYSSLLLGMQALWTALHQLTKNLTSHEQKVVVDAILDDLSRKYLSEAKFLPVNTRTPGLTGKIAGAAALVSGLVEHNEYMLECAIDWVSNSNGTQGKDIATKRALICALAGSRANLERILERSLNAFSNKLQIQYAPTTEQEHLAQTILLVIGYLHRQSPEALRDGPIPVLTMQSVSNRLSSSVPVNRLLGMVIGVGMSQCVDEPDKVMNFDVEEMNTEEVIQLLGLIKIEDKIGDLRDLQPTATDTSRTVPKKRTIVSPPTTKAKRAESASQILSIEEVSSSEDDEDDLIPYQKPNDDPEDSDEDPTLINRDKPRAPIYIVDLIKQLQSPSDKLDIISTALEAAPALIRRKAGFGTELSDNIRSLVSALINLQDGMSRDDHQQQRQEALIACVYAQPQQMGNYLANVYFQGDFSLSQRSTILIAIGLSARELAGFSDTQNTYSNMAATEIFPSKRLPAHLQPKAIAENKASGQTALAGTSNPVSMLTDLVTRRTIQPMAMAAVKSQTGPEILQVTRTSSRLTLAKEKAEAKRTTKTPRNLYQMVVNSIFLPLASPLSAIFSYASVSPGSSAHTSLLHTSIVTLHMQTLTLLLHTLGPAGLSPPANYASVTHETLALLTSLHNIPRLCYDGAVLPSMLGLFLALIDITSEIGVSAQERMLADPFGGTVAELVRWVSGLEKGGRAPPPAKEEDGRTGAMPWTVMAAGIQVRWYEMGKKFQGRMLGFELDD